MDKLAFYSKIFLYLMIAFLIVKNVIFIQQQNKWSPIDEFAHMDYVIKLSEGKIPKITDMISAEIILHAQQEPNRISDISRVDLQNFGMTAFCYEAHHPPVYYLVLSVPNKILSLFHVDVFARLKWLRLFSFGLYVAGLFVLIPLFKQIAQLGYRIPIQYVLGCIVFGLLVATHQRYGLGNNMISPLLVNLFALFLLRSFKKSFGLNFYISLVFFFLCLLSSYANILIAPFIFLIFTVKIIKRISLKNILVSMTITLLFGLLYAFWKHASIPLKSGSDFFYMLLNILMPAGVFNYRYFIDLFLMDTLAFTFLKPGIMLKSYYIWLVLFNLAVSLVFIRHIYNNMRWLFFCGFLLMVFLISGYILNKYVGGVNWHALRHYMAFIPVFYVVATSFILVIAEKIKRRKTG